MERTGEQKEEVEKTGPNRKPERIDVQLRPRCHFHFYFLINIFYKLSMNALKP